MLFVPPLTSVALQNNKTTMTTKPGNLECPPPISFKLSIKNTVEPQITHFSVSTTRGYSLLQAMQEYQNANQGFGFKYKDIPTSGPYVVEVEWNGKKVISGEDTFWETLLYNEGNKEAKPISLGYNICPGDNVYLRFSYF